MARIAACDRGSNTAQNLYNIGNEFNLDSFGTISSQLANVYKNYMVPEAEEWRLPLLEKLLELRRVQFACDEDANELNELIQSLCTS